jgi:hypothetical protein
MSLLIEQKYYMADGTHARYYNACTRRAHLFFRLMKPKRPERLHGAYKTKNNKENQMSEQPESIPTVAKVFRRRDTICL